MASLRGDPFELIERVENLLHHRNDGGRRVGHTGDLNEIVRAGALHACRHRMYELQRANGDVEQIALEYLAFLGGALRPRLGLGAAHWTPPVTSTTSSRCASAANHAVAAGANVGRRTGPIWK
jgi:hypothetical protein